MPIENWVILLICFVVVYIATIMLIISIKKKMNGYKKKESDEVIEWYGPDIYLKEKIYDEHEDQNIDADLVQDVLDKIDRDIYKNKERQRIENVRNNTSNSGTNKINGTRSSDNNSENEN